MATVEASRIGKRGVIVIPAKLRRRFHLRGVELPTPPVCW